MKKILTLLLSICLALFFLTGCGTKQSTTSSAKKTNTKTTVQLAENGSYTSKNDVALYLHTYHKLPKNYITKAEAKKLGWQRERGKTLDKIAPGRSIGGDRFMNGERRLPHEDGIVYKECDIDYKRGNRGPKRLVFDNRSNIYYCADHYNHFEKLY